jgi:preprotein translocase SecE subunit
MSWSMYRAGEGRLTRYGALVVFLAAGAFSAYRWYLFAAGWEWLPFLGRLPRIGVYEVSWGHIGAGLLVFASALLGYRVAFVRPKTSDFLIETEIELRKVTWPEWKPLFRSGTELWGHTYVVIAVVAALALYIFAVDTVFQAAVDLIFFRAG